MYARDRHSVAAAERLRSGPRFWLTPLHLAEWEHALERRIFQGSFVSGDALRLRADLAADRGEGLWRDVGLPASAFDLCADLARRFGATLGHRTLDGLHVACALLLGAEEFWTFDARQAVLAAGAGLAGG